MTAAPSKGAFPGPIGIRAAALQPRQPSCSDSGANSTFGSSHLDLPSPASSGPEDSRRTSQMIRLEVLGGFRVLRDGEEIPSLPSKPQRAAMLVVIAVEGEVSRERLCSILWADSAPDKARHALSQTLYELRQDLGSSWIEASGQTLSATRALETDLDAFEQGLAAEDHEKIVALFDGPFLDGVHLGGGVEFDHWVDRNRSRIHRAVRDAFRAMVDSENRPEHRARLARAWIQFDRLEDEAHHALIEALGMAGSRSEALEHYERYSELIAAELEVEPLEQTRILAEKIRNGEMFVASGAEADRSEDETAPVVESGTTQAEVDRGTHLDVGLPDDLTVLRQLGSGATGSVFLAREPALDRLVAVKVLDPALAKDDLARARFEREARASARILHPHVATVFRVGLTRNGIPFYVMPYVKGSTLAERMRARGPMAPSDVRRMLFEVSSALAAAHQRGLVHRDVRPDNVLYEQSTGRTYLADFGIAAVLDAGDRKLDRLTRTGERLGSPQYMSPEQRDGLLVDGRSDVYSLGVMGWELLTGRRFSSASIEEAETEPDQHLIDLLRRATNEEAAHRPTATEFAEEVAAPTAGSTDSRSAEASRRRRVVQASLGWAVLAITVTIGVLLVPPNPVRPVAFGIAALTLGGGLIAAIAFSRTSG